MHGISPLKRWLIENHLFTRDKNYTHLLLDGGKLNIPESQMIEFFNYYTNDFINNFRNYICEGKTNIFRFHADLDFFQEEELCIDELLDYISTIQSVLKDIFIGIPDIDTEKQKQDEKVEINPKSNKKEKKLKLYVCLTQIGNKEKFGKMYKKFGVHLIWPNIYINTEKSLIIRRLIITKFKALYGERHEHNSWEDVVDESVYLQNGLRMIGSAKIFKCKECRDNSKKRTNCQNCFGKGKIDEGRIYLPTYLFRDEKIDNVEDIKLKNNKNYTHKQFLQYIKETSIRIYDKPETIISSTLPDWITHKIKDFNNTNIIKYKKKSKSSKISKNIKNEIDINNKNIAQENDLIYQNIGINSNNNKNNELLLNNLKSLSNIKIKYSWCIEDKNAKIIINYIKQKFPIYKEEPFREIYLCGTNSSPFYIVSTNSHYCMNVCRQHSNNHIYFIIDKNNIYQKCFSNNSSPDQKFGLCKDYRSNPSPLNNFYKNHLFRKMLEDANEVLDSSPSSIISNSSELSLVSSNSSISTESPVSSIIEEKNIGYNDNHNLNTNSNSISKNYNNSKNVNNVEKNNYNNNKNKKSKKSKVNQSQCLIKNINIKTKFNKNKIEDFLTGLEDDLNQFGGIEIDIMK